MLKRFWKRYFAPIKVGQIWQDEDDFENPFHDRRDKETIGILSIKNGWIQYKKSNSWYKSESRIYNFRLLHIWISDN